MGTKMIVSAVSNLAAPPSTPTIKPSFSVSPTENMMEGSKDKAPVLLRIPYAGTTDGNAFAREIADDSEIGLEEAALYLNVFGELVEKLAMSAQSFHFGIGRADLSISGSLAAGDEAADESRHQLQYTVVPTDEVKKTFAAIECRVPAEEVPAAIRRVRDVDSGDAVIHGLNKFYVQGTGLTCSAAGEKLELCAEDKTTVIANAEVLDATSAISIMAQLAIEVQPGRYYLKLTTKAGGEGTLYPIGAYVTVGETVLPPPPRILRAYSTELGREGVWKVFRDVTEVTMQSKLPEQFTATMRLLDNTTDQELARVRIEGRNTVTRKDAKTILLDLSENTTPESDGGWASSSRHIEVIVETATGIATFPMIAA